MALNDIEHLPIIVTDVSGINDVLLAIDPEIIQMRTDISNLLKELYIRTTENLITRWENDFSLKYDASLTLAQRRQRVLNKLARKKVLTWKNLRALIKSNIGENAQFYISNDSANYYFRIMIDPEMEEVFDRSKFTVVGSPTITDDGIASGFSSGNYLTGSFTTITPSKIIFRTKGVYSSTPNTANGSQTIGKIRGTNSSPSIEYSPNAHRLAAVRFHNNSSTDNFSANITVPLNDGDIVEAEVIATSTSVTLNAKINGVPYTNTWSGNGLYCGAINGYLISNNSNWYWTGSIDLNAFSITADGKEVFNGTKTVPKGIAGLQQAIKQAKPAYLTFEIVVTQFFNKYCGTFYCNMPVI